VHAGLSVPISHVDGADAGVGESFFYTKVVLRDAARATNHVGVALTPVLEIARTADAGAQQVSVGVPVNVEGRRGPTRVYGSAGFFSRGAVFASGAFEFSAPSGVVFTASLGRTHSTADVQDLSVERNRTDLGFGLTFSVTRAVSVYSSVGHSWALNTGGGWIATGLSIYTNAK
jgi:hypothetical protein